MKTKLIVASAFVALIAAGAGVFAGRSALNAGGMEVAEAAQPAPQNAVAQLWAAPVTNADGKPQSLSLLKGHPVVVNFWASWCGPCVEEMPSLAQLHREYAKKGIEFVGLGVDSDKNVKAFGNNAGGLPFTVVIDAKGNVRSTKLGQIQPNELKHTLDAL
jgi:thiol-disulfide isomerase/thioredoxin